MAKVNFKYVYLTMPVAAVFYCSLAFNTNREISTLLGTAIWTLHCSICIFRTKKPAIQFLCRIGIHKYTYIYLEDMLIVLQTENSLSQDAATVL